MSSETPQGQQPEQTPETPQEQQPEQVPAPPPQVPPPPPAAAGPPQPPMGVPPGRPQRIPPRVAPRRRSGWLWGCGIAAGLCLLVLLAVVMGILILSSSLRGNAGWSRGNVAVIRVEGTIQSGGSGGSLFGGSAAGSATIVGQLERASGDESVAAILLRVNSPGGSAAASQEIYDAVVRARQEKPVVVSMGDVAASGGYYVSSPANLIYADPATLTGSIGVITQYMNYQGLMAKLGLKSETMKSGKLKDMLSPTQPLSDDARTVMQGIISEVYKQFVDAVTDGRRGKLTREEVLKVADGRVYCGTQAKELKLIDELGGMHEALLAAGRLAGIKGTPTAREYVSPSLLRELLGSESAGGREKMTVEVSGGLLYNDFAARLVPGPWQALPRPEEP